MSPDACRRAVALALVAGLATIERATSATATASWPVAGGPRAQAARLDPAPRPTRTPTFELDAHLIADSDLPASAGGRGSAVAPARLSDTGLYRHGTLAIDAANRPFSPQYPLWSDGAAKSRWIHLPAGATINASRIDAWDFPVGTRLWKEFEFGGRKVETRYLERLADGQWRFAAYVWNAEQTDAVLAPESGVPGVAEIAPGRRHSVPGVADCRACHDTTRTQVLGFSALQLSTDRDPNAPHAEPLTPEMVTLRSLLAEGRLSGVAPEALATQPRIRASTPAARAAIGYLAANCGGCHNPAAAIATNGLDLAHTHGPASDDACTEVAVRTAVNRATIWNLPDAQPGDTLAIAPGNPSKSALLARMKSRRPLSQMPPLGTVLVDREAVDLVTRWIQELESGAEPCRGGSRGTSSQQQ